MKEILNQIKVLYEDDDVLVIDKPARLLVHADGSSDEKTLVDWLMDNYPTINNVGEPQILKDGSQINRPGIVHRLDRDTSGVMIIAKNDNSFANLKSQFKNRQIKKAYLALCHDPFKDPKASGVIDLPIGRSPADFRRWSAQPGARGQLREAKTEYFLLEQVDGYSLLFCQPHTGRTHQIRAHLKAIHHPIVCDQLYAGKKPCIKSINRQALHARALTWFDNNGAARQVLADLPADLEQALRDLNFSYQAN